MAAESNWVKSLFEQGLNYTGASLCSRLVGEWEFNAHLTNLIVAPGLVRWFELLGTGVWRARQLEADTDKNFPYGIDVDPP